MVAEPQKMQWGTRVGLLLTSIIWMALSITFIIVARHAESLAKIHYISQIIWGLGIAMVLAGLAGAWISIDEIAGSQNPALRVTAAWLIGSAALIGLAARMSEIHWPWPEILCAIVLFIIFIAAQFRKRRQHAPPNPL